jgi:hypothetical protein
VAGQEGEAQHVVLDVVDLLVEVGHVLLLPDECPSELLGLAAEGLGAADVIDAAAPGGGHQPGAGVARHARGRPLLQSRHESVLRQVLGQADVTCRAGQGADEPR